MEVTHGVLGGAVWWFAGLVLGIAGAVDDFLVDCMNAMGVVNPQWQLCFLLILVALVVLMCLRKLGGLLGWVTLLFVVVVLLHHVVPALGHPSADGYSPFQGVM